MHGVESRYSGAPRYPLTLTSQRVRQEVTLSDRRTILYVGNLARTRRIVSEMAEDDWHVLPAATRAEARDKYSTYWPDTVLLEAALWSDLAETVYFLDTDLTATSMCVHPLPQIHVSTGQLRLLFQADQEVEDSGLLCHRQLRTAAGGTPADCPRTALLCPPRLQ